MVLPSFSFFPAALIELAADPEEANNLAGQKGPLPDSDPVSPTVKH
jgi:hypothetical protein